MGEEESLMHMAVADRLREARAASAGRAVPGPRAALRGSLTAVYLDRLRRAITRRVRPHISGPVSFGFFQVAVRLALLGWFLARVFQGALLAEFAVPLVLTAIIVASGLLEYARTVTTAAGSPDQSRGTLKLTSERDGAGRSQEEC